MTGPARLPQPGPESAARWPLGLWRSARSAVALLSVVGGHAPPHRWAAGWYGVVGAGLGAALGGAWLGLGHLVSPLVAATLVVALDAGLTGMLHLDGLADCGDGLIAPMDRIRRLAVMRAPDVGAFGLVVVVVVLALRIAALASTGPSVWLLVALWAASRACMAATAAALPYARAGQGLPSVFAATRPNIAGAAVGLTIAAVAAAQDGGQAVAAVAAVLCGACAVAVLARRRIAGYTGDVLGALAVVGETVGLLVASGQWRS